MKQFLKKEDIQLINGGYLSGKDGSPITNSSFVQNQLHAEYICTFAEMAKGKSFKAAKADSLEDFKESVLEALSAKDVQFVKAPESISRPTTDALAKEALSWMDHIENKDKAAKINSFLQQFTPLHEFEEFGLFFEQGIVKLRKIYTMKEVIDAVEKVIDLLD